MTPLYWWAWASSRWIFKNLFRCRVYNPERVPIIGPVIIAANHESYFDPPFIGSSLPRPINYLARENIFSHWLSGPFFRGLNTVPVDREGGGAKGLKIILERLLKDNGIIIFPEGTRSGSAIPRRFRLGGLVTLFENMPEAVVLPVSISHSWELMKWGNFPITPGVTMRFTVHEPIHVKEQKASELAARVEQIIVGGIED